jgi:hypothetical protein
MNLILDTEDSITRTCHACRSFEFYAIVDDIIVDSQPTRIRREWTGLLVCSRCKTVIWDDETKEHPAENR